jgi:predicted ATPase/DNA-binding CsgD family transcriptional regulator
LRELQALLGKSRLVSLVGCGGIGKSRLARELAKRLVAVFQGRVWLVEFSNLEHDERVLGAIGRVLGVREARAGTLEAQIVAALSHSSLLILDNCEHVADAAASTTRTLLRACPRLTILATSREPLGLDGEYLFEVEPLTVPLESDEVHEENWRSFTGLSLFVDRAQAADPRFTVSPGNAQTIGEITRSLDGIPLAIELAASQLRTLSLEELAHEIDDQLRFRSARRDASDRHRSMQETLLWTYARLDPEARAVWKRFSIFRGGATLPAATLVCSSGSLTERAFRETLGHLVRSSVISLSRDLGGGRYRMLEPVRLFGRERASEEDEDKQTVTAHLEWCRELFPADAWTRDIDQVAWMHLAEVEHPNVTAAFDRALGEKGDLQTAYELMTGCFLAWGLHGWYEDLSHYSQALLSASAGRLENEPHVLFAAGLARWYVYDLEQARRWFVECEAASVPDSWAHGLALFGLGICDLSGASYESALSNFLQAEKRLLTARSSPFLGHTRFRIAQTLAFLERENESVRVLSRNLKTLGTSDDWNRGMTHGQLGAFAWRHDQFPEAEEHFLAALRLQTRMGHLFGAASSVDGLARVRVSQGDAATGTQLLGAAARMFERLGTHPFSDAIGDRESAIEQAQAVLDADRYEVYHSAGERLSIGDVLALVEAKTSPDDGRRTDQLLTAREMEVAALVAQGATNRQISFELVIGLETVKSHIRNILRKLDAESRVQIGVWYGKLHGPIRG